MRTISTDDLIFLIRHDRAKVSRLRTFLSWKDVRKSAKDSDDKGGADAAADDFDLTANDPTLGTGPSVGTRNSKNKKAKVGLPWDVSSFYSEQVPEREDEEDEEEDADGNDKEGTPEPAQPASNGVKQEPIEHGVGKKKARSHTPPNELHIYSAEELGRFRKQELIGDELLLDGII